MTSTPSDAGEGIDTGNETPGQTGIETPPEIDIAAPSGTVVETGIEPWLRDILRCPNCRSELVDAQGESGPELHCTSADCGLQYRIDDGVPVLLVDEARKPA